MQDSLVPGVSIIDDAADIAEEEGGDSSEDDDSKDAVDPSEPAGQGHAATNGRAEAVKGSRCEKLLSSVPALYPGVYVQRVAVAYRVRLLTALMSPGLMSHDSHPPVRLLP